MTDAVMPQRQIVGKSMSLSKLASLFFMPAAPSSMVGHAEQLRPVLESLGLRPASA